MEKERKIKRLSLVALIVAVLGLTVAFAALSQQLTITGTASVTPSTWSVYFKSIAVDSSLTTISDAPSISINEADKDTTITLPDGITLRKPGDRVVYTVVVKNNGSINAKIGTNVEGTSAVVYSVPQCTGNGSTAELDAALICGGTVSDVEYANNFVFKLTNEDGSEVTDDQTLNSGEEKTMKLTIEYKNTTEVQQNPTDDVSIGSLSVSVNYIQAD